MVTNFIFHLPAGMTWVNPYQTIVLETVTMLQNNNYYVWKEIPSYNFL
jgi:hypothetical protein